MGVKSLRASHAQAYDVSIWGFFGQLTVVFSQWAPTLLRHTTVGQPPGSLVTCAIRITTCELANLLVSSLHKQSHLYEVGW